MGFPMRLHGDATTDAPPPEAICPKCNKIREFVITRAKGKYIKKCKVCGTTIMSKRPRAGKTAKTTATATLPDTKKVITCPFCYREFSSKVVSETVKSLKCPYCLSVIKR